MGDLLKKLRGPVGAGMTGESALAMAEAADEIERLRESVITFAGPLAALQAQSFGLPDKHLHPQHYDLLKSCGARMVDFVRHDFKEGRDDG